MVPAKNRTRSKGSEVFVRPVCPPVLACGNECAEVSFLAAAEIACGPRFAILVAQGAFDGGVHHQTARMASAGALVDDAVEPGPETVEWRSVRLEASR